MSVAPTMNSTRRASTCITLRFADEAQPSGVSARWRMPTRLPPRSRPALIRLRPVERHARHLLPPRGGGRARRHRKSDADLAVHAEGYRRASSELLRGKAVKRAVDAQLPARQTRWVLLQHLLLCRSQLSGII